MQRYLRFRRGLLVLTGLLLAQMFALAGVPYEIVYSGNRHVYAGYDAHLIFSTQTTVVKNVYINSITAPTGITAEVICTNYLTCLKTTDGRPFQLQSGTPAQIILRISTTEFVTPGQYSIEIATEMDGVKLNAPLTITVSQAPRLVATAPVGPDIPGFSKWESEMTRLGAKWCNPTEVYGFGDETKVWFYDGTKVYFNIADYMQQLGIQSESDWNACALNIARQYRDYVLQNNGSIPGWRVHPHGLLMAWQRTGDDSYRTALDLLSRKSSYAHTGGGIHYSPLMRETAYVLQGYVVAEKAGLPRNPLMARSATFLIDQFSELFLPDTVINKPVGYHQLFMDGLAAAALIDYYELTADPRVPPTIKAMLDWIWTNAWSETENKLMINPEPLGPQCTWGCQQLDTGLINLTAHAYAWYWQLTGDGIYQLRGDQMFSHALDADISWSGKLFSQNYTQSFNYVKWRLKNRPPQITPKVEPGFGKVTGIALYPLRMRGGYRMATNTVTIDRPAPAGGVVVTLTSSVPTAAQPQATILVPEGKTTGAFFITSFPVTADTPVTISASAGGIAKTALMTIIP